ncbi:NB-ARC domain-containing protein [Saccharothrix hoggarensis]|uniref:NB-ARC domain-containing protein n=1 Tax=Saccharothrix hoggarensis TaxID=913853 RepID=A0ABW3QV03_9PSEU
MAPRNDVTASSVGNVIQASSIGELNINTSARHNAPMQLPPAPHAFVNRDDELRLMDDALNREGSRPALVAISGMAGVGKSALALHWSHSNGSRFNDGHLYANVAEYRHRGGVAVSEIVAFFLRSLGVHQQYLPAQYPERVALFRSLTAQARLLVLLDDVDEPAQVRALSPAAGDSVVISTSRRRLNGLTIDGARFVDLAPFDAEDGERLVTQWMTSTAKQDSTSIRELVRLCAGLPLALSVAGARLAQPRRWTPAELVHHLSDDRQRLGRLTIEPGGSPVRTMFDTAYADLPESARVLYRRLGLHPGPDFGNEVAVVAGGRATSTPGTDLELLCTANLVEELDRGRYRFHDLVRLHARERAEVDDSADQRDTTLGRIVEWYAKGAAAADVAVLGNRWRSGEHDLTGWENRFDAASGMEWLRVERTNLLAAMRAADKLEWHETVWTMCESMWALYHSDKNFADWVESHELGMRAAHQCGNVTAEVRMRNQLARAHIELHEFAAAHEQLEIARRLASDDPRAMSVVLESTGLLYREQGRYGDAVSVFEDLVSTQRDLGDERGYAMQSYQLGDVLVRASLEERAVPVLDDALETMLRLDDDMAAARVRIVLAQAYHRLRREQEAATQLEEAVQTTRRRNQPVKEAQALEVLVGVAQENHDTTRFRTAAHRLLELYVDAGSPRSAEVRRWIDLGRRPEQED